jgi:hypothetical protein
MEAIEIGEYSKYGNNITMHVGDFKEEKRIY